MHHLKLILGGDAMLGRLVAKAIGRFGAAYPLAPVAPLLRGADLAIVNLECSIMAGLQQWQGAPKAFYFGAPPSAIDTLAGAAIGLVSLANNHILDFGSEGLAGTIGLLQKAGIAHTGAGLDLAAATRPACVERYGIRLGMAAFCDHQADFAAGPDRPGITYLDLADETGTLVQWRAALDNLLAQEVDWPILSLHWGPNFCWRPDARQRHLAAEAVSMGWKLVYGHSAHTFHGIEWFGDVPVLYACGGLVDDYRVDPVFRNDRQLLFELTLSRTHVEQLRLHPLIIGRCQAAPADPAQHAAILQRMAVQCGELGAVLDGSLVCPDTRRLSRSPPPWA